MSGVSINRKRSERASGLTVAAVVAALAVGLAFGMDALGVLVAFDDAVFGMFRELGGGGMPEFPAVASWPLLGLVCFGLAFAMIESPGGWRRLVLWVSGGGVIAATVPLAALATQWIEPGGPMVAWLWTGVCGMIYAHRNEPLPVEPRSRPVRLAPATGTGTRGGDAWNEGDGRKGGDSGTGSD